MPKLRRIVTRKLHGLGDPTVIATTPLEGGGSVINYSDGSYQITQVDGSTILYNADGTVQNEITSAGQTLTPVTTTAATATTAGSATSFISSLFTNNPMLYLGIGLIAFLIIKN